MTQIVYTDHEKQLAYNAYTTYAKHNEPGTETFEQFIESDLFGTWYGVVQSVLNGVGYNAKSECGVAA